MSRSEWIVGLAGLLLLALLPLAGHWLRRDSAGRCTLDGVRIEPRYRVRVLDAAGRDREFCCIRCAELWLQRQTNPPLAIRVTDENSGDEIDASAAHFVRSSIVTAPTTGNRIHAFADRANAERHADAANGLILEGPERPFAPE